MFKVFKVTKIVTAVAQRYDKFCHPKILILLNKKAGVGGFKPPIAGSKIP